MNGAQVLNAIATTMSVAQAGMELAALWQSGKLTEEQFVREFERVQEMYATSSSNFREAAQQRLAQLKD